VASPFGTILDMGCPTLLAIFWREGGPLDINEYLYLGNQRVARALNFGSSYYYYADYLGTSRASADENGNKCYDADYFPWGGEQYVFTNTCSQNYKFTGKERDPDMGIDDFGARFYKNTMARFYSPDWSATVEPVPYAKLNNPQSLNLYTYVLDNPLSFRDADGHELGADTLQEVQKITSDSGNAAQQQISAPAAVSGTLTINTISTGDPRFTDGHAWVTFTPDGGTTTTYGTYGNFNGAQGVQGVNVNSESNLTPTTSRSAHISADQAGALSGYIGGEIKQGAGAWTYTPPCSTFASGAWQAGTGEKLSPSQGGILSTPTNLGNAITKANGGQPLGVVAPRAPQPAHSSSFP